MIDLQKVEQAMKYLAETDEPHAKAKALVRGRQEALKTVKATAFLEATGGSGEREQHAYASDQYKAAVGALEQAVYDFELMENKRLRAQLTIDCWRTIEASRRRT